MSFYRFVGFTVPKRSIEALLSVLVALACPAAMGQIKPDSGQILQQSQEPLRLPRREGTDLAPKPPAPPPAPKPQPSLKVLPSRFSFTANRLNDTSAFTAVGNECI